MIKRAITNVNFELLTLELQAAFESTTIDIVFIGMDLNLGVGDTVENNVILTNVLALHSKVDGLRVAKLVKIRAMRDAAINAYDWRYARRAREDRLIVRGVVGTPTNSDEDIQLIDDYIKDFTDIPGALLSADLDSLPNDISGEASVFEDAVLGLAVWPNEPDVS